jgi:hypothetical protein
MEGDGGGVGKVRNERSDIVTRVESTPKKKVRLQGVNLHTTIQGEKGGVERWTRGKVRDKRNEKRGSINGYPVPRERHIITERWKIVRVMCGIQGEGRRQRQEGLVVHEGEVQKLIAAKVELGSGVARRSTWYRG